MSEVARPMLERLAEALASCDCPAPQDAAKAVLETLRGPLPKEMFWAGQAWQDHCSDVDSLFHEMIYAALYPGDVQPHRLGPR